MPIDVVDAGSGFPLSQRQDRAGRSAQDRADRREEPCAPASGRRKLNSGVIGNLNRVHLVVIRSVHSIIDGHCIRCNRRCFAR